MYIGFGPEKGKRVADEDAFGYAMDRCSTDCADDFCKEFAGLIIVTIEDIKEFRERVIEWFYSGNWVRREEHV